MTAFLGDEKGNSALLFGVIATALLGGAALAIDVPNFYRTKARLQSAADAAATAAALDLPYTTAARDKAIELAAKNAPSDFGTITTASDVVFGTYDKETKAFTAAASPTSPSINAVRVFTRRSAARGNKVPTFFAGILNQSSPDLVASATAVRVTPAACFIALGSTGKAFSAGGGGTVSVPNCAIHVNSTAANAFSTTGGATVTAKRICVVGQYNGTGASPTPQTGCTAISDPLSAIPEPTAGSCIATNYSNNGANATLNPGTYCGSFQVSSGTLTLNPGLYHFTGGTVIINSSASLIGTGVTLFLSPTTTLSHSANGTLNLSAATSGTYAGILIFESRTSTRTTKLTASPNFTLDGTLYMPNSDLEFGGSGTYTNVARSGYVIAKSFSYTGSVTMSFDSFTGVTAKGLSNAAVLVN